MPIPESQLETWSNLGAQQTARDTYRSIQNAIDQEFPHPEKDVEVYLQGSYRNSTNIYGNSDVDVIVQLNSTFHSDLSGLRAAEKMGHREAYRDATYLWRNFHADVTQTLRDYYGPTSVTVGDKAITVAGGSGRLDADVVACIQYRRYLSFTSIGNQNFVEGMTFWTQSDYTQIVNYPKVHYEHGTEKNAYGKTNGWFKRVVRVFKNAREKMVQDGLLSPDVAPSYFVECLVYNAPDNLFGDSFQSTFKEILEHLAATPRNMLVAQHQQHALIGPGIEQWNERNAVEFLATTISLWNDW